MESAGYAGSTPVRSFARLSCAHYTARGNDASATFINLPTAAGFTVTGARPDANAALLGLGAEAEIAQNLTIGARVDAEVSERVGHVQGTARLRYSF